MSVPEGFPSGESNPPMSTPQAPPPPATPGPGTVPSPPPPDQGLPTTPPVGAQAGPYGAGGYGMPSYGGQVMPPQQKAPYATAALVFGIIGLTGVIFGITFLVSPVAIVLGLKSRSAVKKAPPGTYSDSSMGTLGLWMGVAGTIMLVVGILILVGFLIMISSLDSSTAAQLY